VCEATNPLTGDASVTVGSGLGLRGLREQAALLGGSPEAGERDGEFVLRRRLPVPLVAAPGPEAS
jgi:hypothetical protein